MKPLVSMFELFLACAWLVSGRAAANWVALVGAASRLRPGCWATRGTAVHADVMALRRGWLPGGCVRLACRWPTVDVDVDVDNHSWCMPAAGGLRRLDDGIMPWDVDRWTSLGGAPFARSLFAPALLPVVAHLAPALRSTAPSAPSLGRAHGAVVASGLGRHWQFLDLACIHEAWKHRHTVCLT